LNTTLMPHSIFQSDACFAYFNKNWGIPMQKCGRPKNMRNVEVRLAQVHYHVRPTEDDHCDHRGHGRSACTSDRRPPMTLGNMRELV